jgi:mRNA deadenylase 3'-5' endonuclease subunit Ccr4
LFERFNFQAFAKFNFLNLFSVYKPFKEGRGLGSVEKWEDGFPEISNYTEDFKAFIDHIFINTNGIELIALKEMPTT